MSELNYETLRQMIRDLKIPPREPSLFDLFQPSKLMGMNVYVEPEVPKVQLRELKLSDGTPLVTKEFRDEYNAWLAARFGYREPLCKDKVLMLSNWGMMVSKPQYALLNSMLV